MLRQGQLEQGVPFGLLATTQALHRADGVLAGCVLETIAALEVRHGVSSFLHGQH